MIKLYARFFSVPAEACRFSPDTSCYFYFKQLIPNRAKKFMGHWWLHEKWPVQWYLSFKSSSIWLHILEILSESVSFTEWLHSVPTSFEFKYNGRNLRHIRCKKRKLYRRIKWYHRKYQLEFALKSSMSVSRLGLDLSWLASRCYQPPEPINMMLSQNNIVIEWKKKFLIQNPIKYA